MDTIEFPLINLKLSISNVAFSIFDIDIYWYAIIIVLGIIVALIVAKFREKQFNIKYDEVLDLCLFLIPISIISARIYYVLFKLGDYIYKPLEILNFRNGGLAIYGGIIGGIITCFVFCKKKKINFIELLDYAAPCLAIRTINRKMGEFF